MAAHPTQEERSKKLVMALLYYSGTTVLPLEPGKYQFPVLRSFLCPLKSCPLVEESRVCVSENLTFDVCSCFRKVTLLNMCMCSLVPSQLTEKSSSLIIIINFATRVITGTQCWHKEATVSGGLKKLKLI